MDGPGQVGSTPDRVSPQHGLTIERMRGDIAAQAGTTPSSVGDRDDLIAVGLDSIAVMKLASLWASRGADITFSDLIEARTLDEWWQLVSARLSPASGAASADDIDESAPFDLATMQHAYWMGRRDDQALGVGCHFYFEFDGCGVDPGRLDAAVRALMRRHGMLRVRVLDDGRQQIAAESAWCGLRVHDLRAPTPDEVSKALEEIRVRESHRRLDVERGEGFDVQLSLLPDDATRVHVNIDMLVSDALSFRILIDELARLYVDPDATLPPIAYSYPRYLKERAAQRAGERARARAYWQARLAALPGPPQLPLVVEPDRITEHRVGRRASWLDGDALRRLTARAREHGLTLPMVLATAFAEVLGAWSAEPAFVLNVPLFDRDNLHRDVPRLVGDFTSSVLLAVDVSGDVPFVTRARQIQMRFRSDAANGAYAGVDVLRDLMRARPDEGRSRAGVVFTSAVGIGDLFGAEAPRQFGALAWMISQTAQVWLDQQATELDGGLLVNWDVMEPLFPPGAIDAMFGAYVGLLAWLNDPHSDWNSPIPSLLPAAQRAMRDAVNATARETSGRLLHEGFFQHAAARPERLALAWGDARALTYGELKNRATRLAGRLAARGVGPGDRVAVTLAKGPAQIEAVLAILCAGAAYVPVGIDQPLARRAQVYASAGTRIVLTSRAERDTIDWPEGLDVLEIEADVEPATPLAALVDVPADALAYIIFTSGSTGEPKGVMVSHRNAMNTIDDIIQRFALTADDRVLTVSALDFDWTVADIFQLLSVGGAVVTIDARERRDAWRWADLVRRWRVTLWQSVPALLDMLLLAAAPADLSSLRCVLLGGDWVGLDQFRRLRALAPACRLIALGGITETSIHCTVFEVTEVQPHWRSIPYGVPLGNVKCRVVDARGRDCPDWVAGELWVGGAGVAQGYAGDPDRTARQFVEHAGERWYRSGDIARYWPDGMLEFLGRADAQIKIRGHRIELGEIEAALEAHPRVARAVAAAVDLPARHIAAAIVLSPNTIDPSTTDTVTTGAIDTADVLTLARERLPEYMLPERITIFDRLPLNATDKIDRGAVRRLLAEQAVSADADPQEAPRNGIERTVADAWAEVLGVTDIGRHQTFFALGGDSLLATRMVSRLRAAGVQHADLRTLFSTPRLKDFAAALTVGTAPARAATLPLHPDARYDPFPPTDVQRAYWLGRRADFTLGGVGSQWYWEFDGRGVDVSRLEDAWNRVVARHDMLRATFEADGWQRVMPTVPRVSIPVDIASGDAAQALGALRTSLSRRVADPSSWPLFEIRAVRYGDDRTRVAFSFDYIVLDALSIMIVFDELTRWYEQPDAQLPPLSLTFRDCVVGRAPDPTAQEAARAYWDAALADLPPAPQLPLLKDASQIISPRFERREARIGADRWRTLTARARQHDLTPTTVLAAAFTEVLAAWTGRDDMTLVLTLFDRDAVHDEIQRIVGDFTSLLLVPHRHDAADGWLASARTLQREVWSSLEHRSLSAMDVLRDLARRSGTPIASIPVVFTSTLGVADDLVTLSFPFGSYVGGLSQTPQVCLDNQVIAHGGELLINWDSVDELFPDGLLDAMFAAYVRSIEWLSAPETDWRQAMPSLLPHAQRAVRARVNATAAPERPRTLHASFFERAAHAPERPAVVGPDERLSYGELANRALRIAADLHARGVRPGNVVAVHLPKSVYQIAAVLGVLAAGAAYVPVGVDQPPARRQRIIDSSGARCTIDRVDAALTHAPLAAPVTSDPDSLAYIIYTSGSTGEPKGVEIAHRAAINTIDDINERFGVGEDDRVLAVSALDFDLSVYDIFGLLSAGGALVLVPEDDRRDAHRWPARVRDERVTIWNSVPALLEMLLTAAGADGLGSGLRLALVSGDWVGLDLYARLAAHAPGCRLVALGGATEASIWSNCFDVTGVPAGWRSIPYGFPLRNQQFRVADARGRDCPDWVPGELWIGGAGVASGYRHRPDDTAARFVMHEGARWYRTGDRGRYWPDGTLEFLGRLDDQVKVRGHRIELGEIEAALLAHPAVAQAVAFIAGADHRALAAAVVGRPEATLVADEIRAFLIERLPASMVPERIVTLASFPLTLNGKVDRGALQRAAAMGDGAARRDDPPEGPIETSLAAVWTELLRGRRVGRHHSFFALGGDSLLATVLIETLRTRMGVLISLRELLANPTVAQLANAMATRVGARDLSAVDEGVI